MLIICIINRALKYAVIDFKIYEYFRLKNLQSYLLQQASPKQLVAKTHKKYVVSAPTGIAAINAGGVTLHSLFQYPRI